VCVARARGSDPTLDVPQRRELLAALGARFLLITLGSDGMSLFTAEGSAHLPVHGTSQVADVTGAGDTVISTCALALAAGARETGVSKGRGGSMHIFDVAHRFMGGYALVGGPFPLAAGIAKGIQMQGGDEICICFLGDAANNQGTFHESLNMAALWNLPVLYVCENNLYGIGTRIDRSTAVVDQYQRVAAYNIPSAQEDGQDFDLVHKAATKAVKHVRSGKGPYFLELMTYRYRGHSMSDSNAYRAKKEERMWSGRDPVIILRDRLIDAGDLTLDEYTDMDTAVLDEIEDEVIRFATESPEPNVADVEKYVLAENDPWVRGGVQ